MAGPRAGMLDLPLEIFMIIAELLPSKDLEALRKVCRAARDFLGFEEISKQALLRLATYSVEGTLSRTSPSTVSYGASLKRLHRRRDRLRLARPAACYLLGEAEEFLYHQGVLIALLQHEIRIIDVHGASCRERVIDVEDFVQGMQNHVYNGRSWLKVTRLLRYVDGHLVCILEHFVLDPPHKIQTLVVFDVQNGRCVMFEHVRNADEVSVFHSSEYLYLGRRLPGPVHLAAVGPSFSPSMGVTSPGISESEAPSVPHFDGLEIEGWNLRGAIVADPAPSDNYLLRQILAYDHASPSPLQRKRALMSSPETLQSIFVAPPPDKFLTRLEFHSFTTCDSGKSSCYATHDGFFYAVTSRANLSPDDFEYTSFYYCYRFKLDAPPTENDKLQPALIFRRNFDEGPVNHGWTTLSLVPNEETGNLQIIESRREWLGNGSVATRSYYIEDLADDIFDPDINPLSRYKDKKRLKDIPQQYRSLMEHYSPGMLFSPTVPRLPSKVHHGEATTVYIGPSDYLMRSYDVGAGTWLDLIESNDGSLYSKIFLRVGSRRIDTRPGAKSDYIQNKTREWSLPDLISDKHSRVLSTGRSSPRAVADERSVVYFSASAKDERGVGQLALITFDSELDFSGTKPFIPLHERGMLYPSTVVNPLSFDEIVSTPTTIYDLSDSESDLRYSFPKRRKTSPSNSVHIKQQYPPWFDICDCCELERIWIDKNY